MPKTAFTLSPLLPDVESKGFLYVAGVDEVGAGCFAGPLMTACYAYKLQADWLKTELPVRVCDSKKLSEKKRLESFEYLKNLKPAFMSIQTISVEKINDLNIFQARMYGLFKAFENIWEQSLNQLTDLNKVKLFVDGPSIPKDFQNFQKLGLSITAESKGDNKYFPIAAASILAKTARDNLMKELSKDFPEYGWQSNVGYPTPAHKEAMKKFGMTQHHRNWELR